MLHVAWIALDGALEHLDLGDTVATDDAVRGRKGAANGPKRGGKTALEMVETRPKSRLETAKTGLKAD